MNTIIDEFHLFLKFLQYSKDQNWKKTDSVHHPYPKSTRSGLGIEYRGKISSRKYVLRICDFTKILRYLNWTPQFNFFKITFKFRWRLMINGEIDDSPTSQEILRFRKLNEIFRNHVITALNTSLERFLKKVNSD